MTARAIGLACGWWLAAILAVAAGAKLRHPAATRVAFEGLGLRWPATLAWAVPAAELVVAVLLVASPPVGSAVAVVVLVAFTVVLVRTVRRGSGAPCACFGSASGAPVSWWDVARNGGLVALALVAGAPASAGRPSVAAAASVGAAVVAAAVVRRVGRAAAYGPGHGDHPVRGAAARHQRRRSQPGADGRSA